MAVISTTGAGAVSAAVTAASAVDWLVSEGWPFLACRVFGASAGFVGFDDVLVGSAVSRERRVSVRGSLRSFDRV
jgi:hypothetical protein